MAWIVFVGYMNAHLNKQPLRHTFGLCVLSLVPLSLQKQMFGMFSQTFMLWQNIRKNMLSCQHVVLDVILQWHIKGVI